MKEAEAKRPGYQRLRILQYDELRRRLTGGQGTSVGRDSVGGGSRAAAAPGRGRARGARPHD